MRYELFLRGDSLDEGALASIERRAAEADLLLQVYRTEEGEARGVDLGVETHQPPTAARRLVEATLALADAHGLSVYDPQLSRDIAKGAAEEVVACYERTAAFTAGAQLQQAPPIQAGARVWLYVIGTVAVLYFGSRLLTCWI